MDEGDRKALESFDPQLVSLAHDNLRNRIANGDLKCEGDFYRCEADEFCKPVVIPFPRDNAEALSDVSLRDLRVNEPKEGIVLRGTLPADALIFGKAAISVLQDAHGNAARLLLFNATTEAHLTANPLEHLARILPRGGSILIRDPILVKQHDLGVIVLWVANPASLQVVSQLTPELVFPGFETNIEQGNVQFTRKHFGAAMEFYSRALALAGNDPERVRALSNRAECWIKLRQFESSLEDANAALQYDPIHEKSITRKVRSLWGLKQYTQASQYLEQRLADLPDKEKAYYPDVAQTQRHRRESEDGNYDLSRFSSSGFDFEATPLMEFAEYVGPVEIQMTDDGRGRGIFLTDNAREGDVLFVSNIVAAVPIPERQRMQEQAQRWYLLAEVLPVCSASPRTLEQVYTLCEKNKSEAPSMDLFKPNIDWKASSNAMTVDPVRIYNVLQRNTEVIHNPATAGLWTLPSFLKHSCIPNVVTKKLANTIFCFAARDMTSGTELVRSYTVETVTKLLQRLDPETACDNREDAGQIAVDVDALIMSLGSKISEHEKSWLRIGFKESYYPTEVICAGDGRSPQEIAKVALQLMNFGQTTVGLGLAYEPSDKPGHVFKFESSIQEEIEGMVVPNVDCALVFVAIYKRSAEQDPRHWAIWVIQYPKKVNSVMLQVAAATPDGTCYRVGDPVYNLPTRSNNCLETIFCGWIPQQKQAETLCALQDTAVVNNNPVWNCQSWVMSALKNVESMGLLTMTDKALDVLRSKHQAWQ